MVPSPVVPEVSSPVKSFSKPLAGHVMPSETVSACPVMFTEPLSCRSTPAVVAKEAIPKLPLVIGTEVGFLNVIRVLSCPQSRFLSVLLCR